MERFETLRPSVNRKARILHVITGLNDGGAEASLTRLCTHAVEFEHHVVSMMDEGKYGPLLRSAGCTVDCLEMPQGQLTLTGIAMLFRIVRAVQPDVVQTWMYHANLIGGVVAKLAAVRSVVWGVRHSNLAPGTVKRSTVFVARLGGLLSRLVPGQIVSCAQQAVSGHVAIGYVQKRFVVVPNGYDLAQFRPDTNCRQQLRAEWGIPADLPLFGMVARFDPQKDHANLLAALGALKGEGVQFACVLVGSGMDGENRELINLIDAYGLESSVILLGRRSDIPAVMSAIDLHVLSSLGEAFPNVLAEAMACGTPCVSTDVGDAALILGDTGWIVPPSDPTALGIALGDAVKSLGDRAKWQARAVATRSRIVEQFDIESMVRGYSKVWRT